LEAVARENSARDTRVLLRVKILIIPLFAELCAFFGNLHLLSANVALTLRPNKLEKAIICEKLTFYRAGAVSFLFRQYL
jgi:hypothetical protein